jgi:hypothetical protein
VSPPLTAPVAAMPEYFLAMGDSGAGADRERVALVPA